MAITVTPNLTLVSNADTTTGWLGNSGQQDLEVKVQGSASYTWQAAKNARTSCTFTPAANINMSATDTHIYFWFACSVFAFAEPKRTGTSLTSGLTFRVTDGSGNYKEWHIAGSDTWGGEWRCFVVDLANTSQLYASSGTLVTSDIDILTWYVDLSNSGTIRIIDNCWNDVVRYGTGLTLTGTAFDIADAAADDALSANRYGVLESIDGVIFCQGKLTIGSGATTTTPASVDEVLIYRDRIGDGKGGMVSATLYGLVFTGSGCVADVDGLICRGAGTTDTTRPLIDASDSNADVTLDGCTFVHCDYVTFASTSDVRNSKFSDCLQVVPSTGYFISCTMVNYVGTEGAILFPTNDTNISLLAFINCDNGVEYDATSDSTTPTFNNFKFDDVGGNYDVNNTKGSAVEILLTNTPTGKANSYNPGGSAVAFTSDPATTRVTVRNAKTLATVQDARVFLEAANATGPFNFEESVSIERSGSTATVTHATHGLANGAWVHITGCTQQEYNISAQITYIGVNSYSYTVSGTPASPATGSPKSTTVLFNALTNSSGYVTDSRVWSGNQPIRGRVAKATTSPLFEAQEISDTIDSTAGLLLTVYLSPDE